MDYEKVLSRIDQPVLITDRLFQVAAMNGAFRALYPLLEPGESVRAFFGAYPALAPLFEGGEGRCNLERDGRLFVAQVSLVYLGGHAAPAARSVLLTEVTDTVRLAQKAAEAGAQLEAYNRQAEAQNGEIQCRIEQLAQASALLETNKFMRDLHDTLGHALTVVNALQGLALAALPDEARARSELREALNYTRLSIADLESQGAFSEEGGLTAFLRRFRRSMARAGLDVRLDVRGEEGPDHQYMYSDLSRICQEAATNSLRHGGATALCVRCEFAKESVALVLTDNGTAPDVVRPGNGLRGMDERANNLFGDLAAGRAPGGGFEIRVRAPVIRAEGAPKR